MTTTAKATAAVGTIADVLRHLAAEFDAYMPEPSSLTFHTYAHRAPIVGLAFDDEGAACVETWIAKYGSTFRQTRQPTADGDKWLTCDSFELLGVTVQLHGRDPRNCTWLGGCDQPSADNDEQLCTGHAPVDGEVVDTVPALTATTTFAEFTDSTGDTWVSRPDGMFALAIAGHDPSSYSWRLRAEVEADFGPLNVKAGAR